MIRDFKVWENDTALEDVSGRGTHLAGTIGARKVDIAGYHLGLCEGILRRHRELPPAKH